MNPNNPNFRTADEWSEVCDRLGQELRAKNEEIEGMKLELENLSVKLQRTVSASFHALLEMSAWLGFLRVSVKPRSIISWKT